MLIVMGGESWQIKGVQGRSVNIKCQDAEGFN